MSTKHVRTRGLGPLLPEAHDRMRAVRKHEHPDRCRTSAARRKDRTDKPSKAAAMQSLCNAHAAKLRWVS